MKIKNLHTNILTVTAVALVFASLTQCGGRRAFTRGTYTDPNEIEMLDDEWNENDMQLVAKKMIASLLESKNIQDGRPTLAISRIHNRTSEHIDTKMLSNKVRTALINEGRFSVVDRELRKEIAEEQEYEDSEYVDQNSTTKRGKQKGVKYLLSGTITSNVQQVGSHKLVYYKITFKVTDKETNTIEWTDEKELRKKFKKRAVGL